MKPGYRNHFQARVYLLDGFLIFRKDRDTYGGGVLIAAKSFMHPALIDKVPEKVEIIAIDVTLSGIQLRIICGYLKPNRDFEVALEFFKTLERLIEPSKFYVIFGDFYLPEIEWANYSFPKWKIYQVFQKFFLSCQPLFQMINFPTRGNNILDLVLTNNQNLITSVECLPPIGKSDHNLIKLSITISITTHKFHRCTQFWKADYTSIRNELDLCDYGFLYNNSITLDKKWASFKEIINKVIKNNIPEANRVLYNKAPWITHNLYTLYTENVNV